MDQHVDQLYDPDDQYVEIVLGDNSQDDDHPQKFVQINHIF